MEITKNQRRVKILIWMSILFTVFQYLAGRFEILIDEQDSMKKCLPYTVFILDKSNTDFERGDIVVFNGSYLSPYYGEEDRIAKIAAGVSGDVLEVTKDHVQIDGVRYGSLTLLDKLNKSSDVFERVEEIPDGHFAALGLLPRAYDSRYWGFVRNSDVIGVAYAIW